MTSIYIVTTGEYSDYTIRGVFAQEEYAKIFVEYYMPNGVIEEYTLDPVTAIPEHGKKMWSVVIGADFTVRWCQQVSIDDHNERSWWNFDHEGKASLGVVTLAYYEEGAKKIASEKLAQALVDGSLGLARAELEKRRGKRQGTSSYA